MSQVRTHLKWTIFNHLRYLVQKFRLGFLGRHVHIDKRVELLRFPKNIFINDKVLLKEGSKICSCNKDAKITIGKNTTIGYNTFIFSSSEIRIGNDCLIAPFVYIVDSNHQIGKERRINEQPNIAAPIIIGDDVWISSNSTILKGVKIGKGAVVAANSVVNTDIPDYQIFGGSPAKKIGERK